MIKGKNSKKKKKDNNLILVNVGKKKYYFTSTNRAGLFLGLQANSVNWAILHNNVMATNRDEKVNIEIIDGSEIPYKYINNDV